MFSQTFSAAHVQDDFTGTQASTRHYDRVTKGTTECQGPAGLRLKPQRETHPAGS